MTWTRLKYACTDSGQYGFNVPASDYVAHGVRLLRTSDLGHGRLSPDDDGVFVAGPVEPRFRLRTGDLLLSRSGTVGRSFTVPSNASGGTFAGFLVRFRPRNDVDSRYLHYSAQSDHFLAQVERNAITSTIQNFNAERYANVPIYLPEFGRQRQIADFLDDQVTRIDDAVSLRRKQISLLAERRRQTIRIGVAGALGQTGAPTPVPWIPCLGEGAELRPLARILTLQRGVDLTSDQQRIGDIPVVTSAGMVGTHDRAVVGESGVVVGRYGSGGSVHWIDGRHWPHNTTLYVRSYQGNNRRWIFFLLLAYPYEALQARSAVPGINRNDMARDPMPWLPRGMQDRVVGEIEVVLEHLDHSASQQAASISLLTERKRALITAAVTGEFDVSTASTRAAAAVTG